jgi:flagellar basal-body rod modification protein FlgD
MSKVANQDTFLKLLVAQIRNQNPLNPSDGMQFVSQLAQFSELEQVIGIRAELSALTEKVSSAGSDQQATGTEKP